MQNTDVAEEFSLKETHLGNVLVPLRSVQDWAGHVIRHAGHLGSSFCGPQQLVGCLVIQGQVGPVCLD